MRSLFERNVFDIQVQTAARREAFDKAYPTQYINQMVLERQLPHKIVNLLFTFTKLTIVWGGRLSKTS